MFALCKKCKITFDIDEKTALSGEARCPKCDNKLAVIGIPSMQPSPSMPVSTSQPQPSPETPPSEPPRPKSISSPHEWDFSGLEDSHAFQPSKSPVPPAPSKTMIGPFAAWKEETTQKAEVSPPATVEPPAKIEVNMESTATKPQPFQSPVFPQPVAPSSDEQPSAPGAAESAFFGTAPSSRAGTDEMPLWDEELSRAPTKIPKLASIAIGVFVVGAIIISVWFFVLKRGKDESRLQPATHEAVSVTTESKTPEIPAAPAVETQALPAKISPAPEEAPSSEKGAAAKSEKEQSAAEEKKETKKVKRIAVTRKYRPTGSTTKKTKPGKEEKVKVGEKAKKYYENGTRYFLGGKYEFAIREYRNALKLDPNFAYAYRGLGATYASIGGRTEGKQSAKWNELAIKSYEKYVELDPDASDANQVREIIKDYYKNK